MSPRDWRDGEKTALRRGCPLMPCGGIEGALERHAEPSSAPVTLTRLHADTRCGWRKQ